MSWVTYTLVPAMAMRVGSARLSTNGVLKAFMSLAPATSFSHCPPLHFTFTPYGSEPGLTRLPWLSKTSRPSWPNW
jgi:hypothetical protein